MSTDLVPCDPRYLSAAAACLEEFTDPEVVAIRERLLELAREARDA